MNHFLPFGSNAQTTLAKYSPSTLSAVQEPTLCQHPGFRIDLVPCPYDGLLPDKYGFLVEAHIQWLRHRWPSDLRPRNDPTFWWPIERSNLFDVVFGKVAVVSIYNPAHFWEMLRQRGFSVDLDAQGRFIAATRKLGERLARLENMDHFNQLSGQVLLSDESIMGTVEKALEFGEGQKFHGPLKIEILPVLRDNS